MLEVAEIKALVIYLFTYKTFKKGYKKGLWQLRAFFVSFYWCYFFELSLNTALVLRKLLVNPD